jgi:hypothetical protein
MSGEPRDPQEAPGETAPLSLIYLDVDDEITSAAARIRAAGADDVALVLPFGSRLATSRINFRLLAREAAFRGKRLEIIAADAASRALSVAAGLPTHASVAAFEARRAGGPDAGEEGAGTGAGADTPTTGGIRGRAGAARAAAAGVATAATSRIRTPGADDDSQTQVMTVPRRRAERVPIVGPPRPPVRRGLAIGLGLAVLVALLAFAFLGLEYLPTATITLHPRSAAVGPVSFTVEARENVTAPDPVAMTIPAQRFTFPVQATQTFPATGTHIDEVKATGTVTFSNFDTGGGVKILKGAVVSTRDGIEFATVKEITLPRATIQFPFTLVPSTADVDVQALVAGTDGNVGNNTIVVAPRGANRQLLQVTNVEATTGGAHTEVAEVSQDDIDAAEAAITAALVTDLDGQVATNQGVPPGVTLFPSTKTVGDPSYSVDPSTLVGTQVDSFDLGATADGSALGVDPSPIDAIAETQLAGKAPEGWSIQPGSAQSTLGTPAVLGSSIAYPVTVTATEVRDVDKAALVAAVRGLGVPEARSTLDDFGDVSITVWPDWVTRIPTRDDRITFVLADPQPSAPPP